MPVRAVLFDFGGVIIDSPFTAFSRIERAAGVPEGLIRRVNATDPDTNAWARLERGAVDVDAFATLFAAEAAALGATLDGRALVDALLTLPSARADARPAMLAAVAGLRADGVRTVLLSNNVAPMRDDPRTRWVYDDFDAVVESSLVGVRKPDPAIYPLALGDVAPADAVFLDDLGINLKPARALGLATIKVGDPDVALAQLRALL